LDFSKPVMDTCNGAAEIEKAELNDSAYITEKEILKYLWIT
jgi:hypothetical protein